MSLLVPHGNCLGKREFAEIVEKLSLSELLNVEFLAMAGGNWRYMISKTDIYQQTFHCNLCEVLLYNGAKTLHQHIIGKRHRTAMIMAENLYHPLYTYPKSMVKVPLLSEPLLLHPLTQNACNNYGGYGKPKSDLQQQSVGPPPIIQYKLKPIYNLNVIGGGGVVLPSSSSSTWKSKPTVQVIAPTKPTPVVYNQYLSKNTTGKVVYNQALLKTMSGGTSKPKIITKASTSAKGGDDAASKAIDKTSKEDSNSAAVGGAIPSSNTKEANATNDDNRNVDSKDSKVTVMSVEDGTLAKNTKPYDELIEKHIPNGSINVESIAEEKDRPIDKEISIKQENNEEDSSAEIQRTISSDDTNSLAVEVKTEIIENSNVTNVTPDTSKETQTCKALGIARKTRQTKESKLTEKKDARETIKKTKNVEKLPNCEPKVTDLKKRKHADNSNNTDKNDKIGKPSETAAALETTNVFNKFNRKKEARKLRAAINKEMTITTDDSNTNNNSTTAISSDNIDENKTSTSDDNNSGQRNSKKTNFKANKINSKNTNNNTGNENVINNKKTKKDSNNATVVSTSGTNVNNKKKVPRKPGSDTTKLKTQKQATNNAEATNKECTKENEKTVKDASENDVSASSSSLPDASLISALQTVVVPQLRNELLKLGELIPEDLRNDILNNEQNVCNVLNALIFALISANIQTISNYQSTSGDTGEAQNLPEGVGDLSKICGIIGETANVNLDDIAKIGNILKEFMNNNTVEVNQTSQNDGKKEEKDSEDKDNELTNENEAQIEEENVTMESLSLNNEIEKKNELNEKEKNLNENEKKNELNDKIEKEKELEEMKTKDDDLDEKKKNESAENEMVEEQEEEVQVLEDTPLPNGVDDTQPVVASTGDTENQIDYINDCSDNDVIEIVPKTLQAIDNAAIDDRNLLKNQMDSQDPQNGEIDHEVPRNEKNVVMPSNDGNSSNRDIDDDQSALIEEIDAKRPSNDEIIDKLPNDQSSNGDPPNNKAYDQASPQAVAQLNEVANEKNTMYEYECEEVKKEDENVIPTDGNQVEKITIKGNEDCIVISDSENELNTNRSSLGNADDKVSLKRKTTTEEKDREGEKRLKFKCPHGLIGIEYVLRIVSKIRQVRYDCTLCKLNLNGREMQRHLEGYNHRLKYCENHFPKTLQHYKDYMVGISEYEIFKVLSPVLAKLAMAIEACFGRNTPFECSELDYNAKHDFTSITFASKHFNEDNSSTQFTSVISIKDIQKFIFEKQFYKPPVMCSEALFDADYIPQITISTSTSKASSTSPNNKSTASCNKNTNSSSQSTATVTSPGPKMHKKVHKKPLLSTPILNNPSGSFAKIPPFAMQVPPLMSKQINLQAILPDVHPVMTTVDNSAIVDVNVLPAALHPNVNETNVMISPETVMETNTTVDNETHRRMVEEFLQNTCKVNSSLKTKKTSTSDGSSDNNSKRDRRSKIENKSNSGVKEYSTRRRKRSRSLTPPSRPSIRRADSEERSHQRQKAYRDTSAGGSGISWYKYYRRVDNAHEDLRTLYRKYRNDLESHPQYNSEWLKYWNRRKNELIQAGLDYRTYNYQFEWIRFFKVRIEELYREEMENIKIEIRKELSLPMSNDSIRDNRYHVNSSAIPTVRNDPSKTLTKVPSEVDPLVSAPSPAPAPVLVPPSAPVLDVSMDNEITGFTSLNTTNSSPPPSAIIEGDTTNPISVLRLLTALEDHLGSLGPKIVNLLSLALQAEKHKGYHLYELLADEENYCLIETAKEKFKGLIIANLYDGTMEYAIRKAVTEAESLLQCIDQYRLEMKINQHDEQEKNRHLQASSTSSFTVSQSSSPSPPSSPISSYDTMANNDVRQLKNTKTILHNAKSASNTNLKFQNFKVAVSNFSSSTEEDSHVNQRMRINFRTRTTTDIPMHNYDIMPRPSIKIHRYHDNSVSASGSGSNSRANETVATKKPQTATEKVGKSRESLSEQLLKMLKCSEGGTSNVTDSGNNDNEKDNNQPTVHANKTQTTDNTHLSLNRNEYEEDSDNDDDDDDDERYINSIPLGSTAVHMSTSRPTTSNQVTSRRIADGSLNNNYPKSVPGSVATTSLPYYQYHQHYQQQEVAKQQYYAAMQQMGPPSNSGHYPQYRNQGGGYPPAYWY